MKELVEGIHRFQTGVFGHHQELFERLAKRQAPEILFIACSDSRIDPNLITQTSPGDLFVLRNVGNIIPPYSMMCGGEAAAIEYAIDVLQIKDIIVCGHTHCGAMKAVLAPDHIEELSTVKGWLNNAEATRRIMKRHYAHLDHEEKLDVCIEENVLVQIENLHTHPSVLVALSQDRLQIHAWVYDIENGQMTAFNAQKGQFIALSNNQPLPPGPSAAISLAQSGAG